MTRSRTLTALLALITLTVLGRPAAAHYDTTLGRWLERDPAGFVDGMNLYEYGESSPICRIDPSGERFVGIGKLEATMGPYKDANRTTKMGSNFKLRFLPTTAFVNSDSCCDEVRFVQVAYYDDDSAVSSLLSSIGFQIPKRTWFNDSSAVFYDFHTRLGNPKKNTATEMVDAPKVNGLANWGMHDLETCAVCSHTSDRPSGHGPEYGDVYGCITWGHSFQVSYAPVISPMLARATMRLSFKRRIEGTIWASDFMSNQGRQVLQSKRTLTLHPGHKPSTAKMRSLVTGYGWMR